MIATSRRRPIASARIPSRTHVRRNPLRCAATFGGDGDVHGNAGDGGRYGAGLANSVRGSVGWEAQC